MTWYATINPNQSESVFREIHPGDSLSHHGRGGIDDNRVRSSFGSVPVARPPGKVGEVLSLHRLVYLELNERRSVRGEDDMVEACSVGANLYMRKHPRTMRRIKYIHSYIRDRQVVNLPR